MGRVLKGEVPLSKRTMAHSGGSSNWPAKRELRPKARAGYVPRGSRERSYGKSTQARKRVARGKAISKRPRTKLLKWVGSRRERSG